MMDSFVTRFIRSSLVWLGIGVLLGVAMAVWPYQALVYRPAHMHANLLGFVSMMIFGVAYHVIPRFTGSPLFSPRLAATHVWFANGGLALMVLGWLARPSWLAAGVLVPIGGGLAATGAFMFIVNIWRTLDGDMGGLVGLAKKPAAARPGAAPAGRQQG